MKRITNRVFSFLLCIVLCVTMLPVYARAEGETEPEAAAVEVYSTRQKEIIGTKRTIKHYTPRPEGLTPMEGKLADANLNKAWRTGVNLNAMEQALYREVLARAAQTAAGELACTDYSIPVSNLGLKKMSWTATELGLTENDIIDGDDISDKAMAAVDNQIPYDINDIIDTLLADNPYEFYWLDKDADIYCDSYGYRAYTDSSGEWNLEITDSIVFRFTASQEYAGGYGMVDIDKCKSTQKAIENANAIVKAHENESDYEKLQSYRNEICGLTDYNHAAVTDGAPYGNPWQLIWVFDEDPDTTVVCEGYSKAFQLLCDRTEFDQAIDCITVSGNMSGGTSDGDHMWNIVTMEDGKHYIVDVTNCDEETIGYPNLLFLTGAAEGGSVNAGYRYNCNGTAITYTYDDTTRSLFAKNELTMSTQAYTQSEVVDDLPTGLPAPEIPTTGDIWDGITTVAPSTTVTKDGAAFYKISTCAELAYVAQTGGEWLNRNYLLANDLILNNAELAWNADGVLSNDTSTLHSWIPIGNATTAFSGIFDGGGHTISGVYLDTTDSDVGLFGISTGTIRNLTVTNSYVRGTKHVGGICGQANILERCVFNGAVTGTGDFTGGICASASSVNSCANFGMVRGTYDVGGVCGSCTQETAGISGCANSGAVIGGTNVGGICGYSILAISDCYNVAKVTGTTAVGGIVGNLNNGSISNCYSAGNVTSAGSAGAIVGSNITATTTASGCYYLKIYAVNADLFGCSGVTADPNGFTACDAAAMKTQATYVNWDFTDTWHMDSDINAGYPYLAWQTEKINKLDVKIYHSCSLGNNLSINYYLPTSYLEGYSNVRLHAEKNKYNQTGSSFTVNEYDLTDHTLEMKNGVQTYHFVFNNIPAKEIGDDVCVTVLADKDGMTYSSELDTYSVKTYAMNQLAKSSSTEALKTVLVDLLNYGAEAQTYFNYRTANLANADLTAEQQALGTQTLGELTTVNDTVETPNATAHFIGKSVVLGSEILIKYYMKLDEGQSLNNVRVEFTYTTAKGLQKTVSFAANEFDYDSAKNLHVIRLGGIAAKDTGRPVTAKIYDGDTLISDVLTYSIESYAYNQLGKTELSAAARAIITAMMIYCKSAENYFTT